MTGMSVEMVAMLLASIIQGKVVVLYHTEKQNNCQHLDQAQEAAQSTSSPPSLHGTVPHCLGIQPKLYKRPISLAPWQCYCSPTLPGISGYTVIYYLLKHRHCCVSLCMFFLVVS